MDYLETVKTFEDLPVDDADGSARFVEDENSMYFMGVLKSGEWARMIPSSYTIEEIKAAFWNMFHMSGEYWFEHRSSDERNSKSTESFWKEFLEYIIKGDDDKS